MKTIVLALLCCFVQVVFAASPFSDHLLTFKDMHINAGHTAASSIFWVNSDIVVVNANTEEEHSKTLGMAYVAIYDLKHDSVTKLANNARIICIHPEKNFGILEENLPPMGVPRDGAFRRLRITTDGQVTKAADAPSSADCFSTQFSKDWGSQAKFDLGPGNGVLLSGNGLLKQPLIRGSHVSYIDESGARTEFPQFAGAFLQRKFDLPWRHLTLVGGTGKGDLAWSNSNLIVLPVNRKLYSFFKNPSWNYTRNGYLIKTGVGDPYNGDTFYFRDDMATPVRIYAYQGFGDDIGDRSISPNGCIWVTTHWSTEGWRNRLFASLTAGTQSLHYTNLCKEFGEKQ